MIITSKDNEIIKEIKKLKDKKNRTSNFIVEGIKMCKEAIEENAQIECFVFSDMELKSKFANLEQYKVIDVSEKVFSSISDVVTPQGVLAVIKKNENANSIDFNENYILALDSIQDPGNLGTIIRTADSANIKQIIVSKTTADAFSPKVIRSTMGAIFRVKIIETDLAETLKEAKNQGFKVITTSLDTEKSIYDVDYSKSIVVIGNEANGVSKEIQEISDVKVKIPMLGKTESLNASVATGIMIYEYVRKVI